MATDEHKENFEEVVKRMLSTPHRDLKSKPKPTKAAKKNRRP